jgi:molecular chaperone GrpE (heat shock protein)
MGTDRMTKKTWIVWALFLLLPGAVGLSIQFAQKKAIQSRIAQASQQIAQNPAVQEYLQMYEQWSDLPADQKANNPWGHGSYGGIEIRDRLKESQSAHLVADLSILEKDMTHYPEELADVIYGFGWQQEVADYKKERAVIEIILIGSIFFLAGGGLVLTGGLVRTGVLFVKKKVCKEEQASDSEIDETKTISTKDDISEDISSINEMLKISELSLTEESQIQNTGIDSSKQKGKGYFQSRKKTRQKNAPESDINKSTELPMKPTAQRTDTSGKGRKDPYFGWTIEEADSAELETLMTTEPLTKELTELTEEVSAIRQFAAQQQDQMRKLQDGYDWMIIRRFCLRIIRSVDNIEDRITLLESQNQDASVYLEDIRDELIFALESSGVEQFKPDLEVSFKGLEKYAEAVRERVFTEDSNLVGCIARVARPGYQYLVNDEDVKIVRCAQVMLYETKQN